LISSRTPLLSATRAVLLSLAVVLPGATAALALAPARALADGTPNVTSTLDAYKVVQATDGTASLVSAAEAKPGDLLEYRAVYANAGDGAARGVMATLPIPAGVELVSGTAVPEATQGSLDGTTFAPLPLVRKVLQPDGTLREVPVPASEIRALRWALGALAPGATVVVRARVVVSGAAPAAR